MSPAPSSANAVEHRPRTAAPAASGTAPSLMPPSPTTLPEAPPPSCAFPLRCRWSPAGSWRGHRRRHRAPVRRGASTPASTCSAWDCPPGKRSNRKLPTLGRGSMPAAAAAWANQPRHSSLWARECATWAVSAHRSDPRGLCRLTDVEGSAHTVQHIHHRRRRIGPAEAQRRQTVDLGEGAQHDNVVGLLDQGPRAADSPLQRRTPHRRHRRPEARWAAAPDAGGSGPSARCSCRSGLLGLARNSRRVLSVTRAMRASTSAVSATSGAATTLAPAVRAEMPYIRKPCSL